MKAVISNRIYMEVSPEYHTELNSLLTYKIPTYNPQDPPTIIKNIGTIRKGLVSIPSGRMDLIPPGYEIVDKRMEVPVEFPKFKYDLRESQQAVHDEVDSSCIINAWVSWGKTFTGLAIAANLGQKTLVVVHTVQLRNQWAKEVRKVFGIEPGVIGSGKFNTNSPIVVGNIQSLNKHMGKLGKMFGTVILDEMHHISAATFSRVIDKSYAKYKIGLSGTIERKDGKHVVFKDYFSDKLFQPPKENYMVPTINIIKTDTRFMDGRAPWANKVTALCQDPEYIDLVASLAKGYADIGHKVLVVGGRVDFLHRCAELVGEQAVAVTGRVTDDAERERMIESVVHDKDVVFGTQAIFSEGISQSAFSCLVLANPLNNMPLLTQLIGRVIRLQEGKIDPIIVDIHLKGNTVSGQASARMGHYMREGYQMKEIDLRK